MVLSHICILHLSLSYFRAQLLRARTFLSVSEISWVINDGWSEMGDIIKFDDLFLYKTNAVDHYHSVWQKSVPGFSTQTDNLKEWIGHAIKAGQIQRDPDIFVSCTLCEHAILGSWGWSGIEMQFIGIYKRRCFQKQNHLLRSWLYIMASLIQIRRQIAWICTRPECVFEISRFDFDKVVPWMKVLSRWNVIIIQRVYIIKQYDISAMI